MKEILARDSERLLVFDDKVKYRGLFSWLLLKIVSWAVLFGLVVYGLIGLPEKLNELFQKIDNVSPETVVGVLIMVCLSMVAGWIYLKTRK